MVAPSSACRAKGISRISDKQCYDSRRCKRRTSKIWHGKVDYRDRNQPIDITVSAGGLLIQQIRDEAHRFALQDIGNVEPKQASNQFWNLFQDLGPSGGKYY